jgi:putative ABC transport system permease protein
LRPRDILSYSFSAIRLRKLRTGLTTLGVIIGIAAIVALLSITQGLQSTITRQLQTGFATNTLIVTVGGGFGQGGEAAAVASGSGFKLLVNDTQLIDNITNANVETSMAIIQRVCYVESNGIFRTCTVVGVDFAEYSDIYSSTFVGDNNAQIPLTPENDAIVVGRKVSLWPNGTLFCGAGNSVQILWTNATTLPPVNETYAGSVAVVLKEIGGFGLAGPSDSDVYIPISQARTFFGTNEADMIIVKLTNDDNATIMNATEAIKAVFGNQVSVTSATAVLNVLSNVFSVVQLFLAGIAAISLLVAGIGIMNIMIVSLMERTREIGILKAMGMRGSTVLLIFLFESVIIGLIGAAVGVMSGWTLANVVALVFRGGGVFQQGSRAQSLNTGGITITPILTPTLVLLALVFGVGVSAIFALYPAWRASRLKPVEALRYE